MTKKVDAIPAGFTTLTPYLITKDADKALTFYAKAFNATEVYRMDRPDGKVGHAQLKIGNSFLMISEEWAECKTVGPETLGGTPVNFYLYVENVDEWFNQAVKAGGTELYPVQVQFYGDRMGVIKDPFGFIWNIATHVEDVDSKEIERRMHAMTC